MPEFLTSYNLAVFFLRSADKRLHCWSNRWIAKRCLPERIPPEKKKISLRKSTKNVKKQKLIRYLHLHFKLMPGNFYVFLPDIKHLLTCCKFLNYWCKRLEIFHLLKNNISRYILGWNAYVWATRSASSTKGFNWLTMSLDYQTNI